MIRILIKIFNRLRNSYTLNSYNDFTIAEHFRKQGAHIGKDNRLEIRTLSPEPYLITIGNHCTIAPNVQFLTHDGAVWVFTENMPDIQKFGPITILDNCFIGMNAILMPNVTIGPNAIVGAGSIVTKNVSKNTIVAGNPARKISTLKQYQEKAIKTWEQQKPPGYFQTIEKNKRYSPQKIHDFKTTDLALLRQHLERLFSNNNDHFLVD